ncbi:hypothetical protein [Paraburkholderia graminis]|uniref:Uncharacterized protein n=1 Tax=Paraburkholderia graminis TaxID=60548 RepID=A0ABD5CSG0_9BURK|nr:hypothetical protein [Paraburkholderia graminis]MDR6207495.1 hypothetical protein [Paraburkholderia graminis]
MAVWSALLLAPFLTLSNLSLTYALVPRSCDAGTTWMLHAVTLASAVLSAAATVGAWRHWMGGLFPPDATAKSTARAHFLAQVATLVGLLSTFVLFAQYLPQWVLQPCAQ